MTNDININELRNPHHAACPDHWQDCNDARKFVERLLDPAPITAEALAGLGFVLDDGLHRLTIQEDMELQLYYCDSRKEWRASLLQDGDIVVWTCGSLGQLTALLLALEGEKK